MAKLIRILAASLGGGLVLGAGIRLGEQLLNQSAGGSDDPAGGLSQRLGQLEGRLSDLEAGRVAPPAAGIDLRGIESRIDEQAAEVSAVRVRLDAGARQADMPQQTEARLRAELRAWVDQRVDERLRGVENNLRRESDEAQREMLNAVVESVQTRVIQRISKLEEEVAGQAAGMRELRECTLRTEQSMHKLLGGIDRLIAAQPVHAPPAPESAPAPEQQDRDVAATVPATAESEREGTALRAEFPPAAGLPSFEAPSRRRRWSIFG